MNARLLIPCFLIAAITAASARSHESSSFERFERKAGLEHHESRAFEHFERHHGFENHHRHFFRNEPFFFNSGFYGGYYYSPYYADYYPDYYEFYDRPIYRGRVVTSVRHASREVEIEARLADEGYYNGQIDGIIGPL